MPFCVLSGSGQFEGFRLYDRRRRLRLAGFFDFDAQVVEERPAFRGVQDGSEAHGFYALGDYTLKLYFLPVERAGILVFVNVFRADVDVESGFPLDVLAAHPAGELEFVAGFRGEFARNADPLGL